MAVRVPKRSEIGSSLSRGKSFFCVLLCTSSLYRTEKASMDSRTKKKQAHFPDNRCHHRVAAAAPVSVLAPLRKTHFTRKS